MKIEIKDLQVGDEIIIPSNSNLKYLKVLKLPQLHPNLNWRGEPYYRSVRCSIGGHKETKTHTRYNTTYNWTRTVYKFDTDCKNHKLRINVDLNDRHIYLVKREENLEQEQKSSIFA